MSSHWTDKYPLPNHSDVNGITLLLRYRHIYSPNRHRHLCLLCPIKCDISLNFNSFQKNLSPHSFPFTSCYLSQFPNLTLAPLLFYFSLSHSSFPSLLYAPLKAHTHKKSHTHSHSQKIILTHFLF